MLYMNWCFYYKNRWYLLLTYTHESVKSSSSLTVTDIIITSAFHAGSIPATANKRVGRMEQKPS